MHDPDYVRLKNHIIEATGLNYYNPKDEELLEHIARRMALLGLRDHPVYLALLLDAQAGEIELDHLIKALTIGETFFFRHRELFDALRDLVFPELIDRNQQTRRLRIWSAGCSTGAEAYSIAIMLRRDLGHMIKNWEVTILGTDINRDFLAHARRAEFGEWAFRSTPEDLRPTCFLPSGKLWAIRPEYRQGVSFQYHNLAQHSFPSPANNIFAFDLILCRNVMIYFGESINRKIIAQFHECLVEGGWLAVGHSEPNIELFRSFQTVNAPGTVLYQKITGTRGDHANGRLHEERAAPSAVWTAPILAPMGLPASINHGSLFRHDLKVEEEPPSTSTGLAQVRSMADRGEWDQALDCCRRLLEKNRLNPAMHFYHALLLERRGRHEEREHELRRTIYLDRDFVMAHYHLGVLLQGSRDPDGAARSFNNAIRLLEGMDDAHIVADADGLTAGALKQLARMQLEVLQAE